MTRVALGVFEGLISEWPVDPAAEARVWRKRVIRKELQAQLKMIKEIASLTSLDAENVKALRARIGALKVKTAPRAKEKAPAAVTNQTLFEQYRRMVESDLKGQAKFQAEPTPHPYLFALTYMGYWMARYSRGCKRSTAAMAELRMSRHNVLCWLATVPVISRKRTSSTGTPRCAKL